MKVALGEASRATVPRAQWPQDTGQWASNVFAKVWWVQYAWLPSGPKAEQG